MAIVANKSAAPTADATIGISGLDIFFGGAAGVPGAPTLLLTSKLFEFPAAAAPGAPGTPGAPGEAVVAAPGAEVVGAAPGAEVVGAAPGAEAVGAAPGAERRMSPGIG
jgi:hypothetical protein